MPIGARFEWSAIEIRRFRCRDCQATCEDADAARKAAERSTEAVVETVARVGFKEASALVDLDAKTVTRWTQAWVANRLQTPCLPSVTSLRRAAAAASYIVGDEASGTAIHIFSCDAQSIANFADFVHFQGVEMVLIEFDMVAREALKTASSEVAIARRLSEPRLDTILTGLTSGMDAYLLGESVLIEGWTPGLFDRLRAIATTPRARLFMESWQTEIKGGLAAETRCAWTPIDLSASCHPLRLGAMFACLLRDAGAPGVPWPVFELALNVTSTSPRLCASSKT